MGGAITGEQLFSLIESLDEISVEMARIIARDDFRVSNEYSISGYEVEAISRCCEQAKQLISKVNYKPQ